MGGYEGGLDKRESVGGVVVVDGGWRRMEGCCGVEWWFGLLSDTASHSHIPTQPSAGTYGPLQPHLHLLRTPSYVRGKQYIIYSVNQHTRPTST